MAVGQTDELDGEFAAQEILSQCADALDGQEPQAGLLLASHDLDIEEFLSVVTISDGKRTTRLKWTVQIARNGLAG